MMATTAVATETPQQAARRLSAGAIRDGFQPQPIHTYTNESGSPLFWRIRLKHPATGEKWIRPMHLEDGEFVMGEPSFDGGKPLYRLHEIAGNPDTPVVVVEGEPCADALAKLGIAATTSGGAGSAEKADWTPLAGRAVTVWPDFDEAGQQYAADVAERLRTLGCTVRTIDAAQLGVPPKGDAVDWLRAHPDATARDVLALPVAPVTGETRADPSVALVASVARWPDPIAEDAYHGLAGEVVSTIEPHTEADPVALLAQFLVAFGSCLGRGPHYQVEGDDHHANLYAVLVGDTSKARKGTSWGRIRALFERLDDPWATRCVHSGLSSGEGVIWAVRDPIVGREKQGKGADAQHVEIEVDAGVSDKRLLVVESEFANVLRVMGREGNTLSRVIRDGWDKGNLAVMTKTSPAVATGAHLSIIGHITGDELRRYLDRTEAANGFANRFLYLCVRRARLLPHGGDLDESALRPLAQRLAVAIDTARQIERVRMDGATRAAWERVYPELSEGRPGLVGNITARGEAQVIRLATLFALIDGADTMNLHHLKAALALWTYAEDSASYIFGDSRGDPLADALAQALRDAGADGMTRTGIRDHFRRHADAGRIDAALSVLSASGTVTRSKVQTGGRDAEVWCWAAT